MALLGLSIALDAIDKTLDDVNKKVIKVYTKGLGAIVTATPVHFKDGGRLRNNWFLTDKRPSRSKRGKGSNGAASFSSIKNKMPKNVLGKRLFFTNNMSYANTVEYGGYAKNPELGTRVGNGYQKLSSNGYSRQAPKGMVRINLRRMERELKRI
jgi:hypothetical protein